MRRLFGFLPAAAVPLVHLQVLNTRIQVPGIAKNLQGLNISLIERQKGNESIDGSAGGDVCHRQCCCCVFPYHLGLF